MLTTLRDYSWNCSSRFVRRIVEPRCFCCSACERLHSHTLRDGDGRKLCTRWRQLQLGSCCRVHCHITSSAAVTDDLQLWSCASVPCRQIGCAAALRRRSVKALIIPQSLCIGTVSVSLRLAVRLFHGSKPAEQLPHGGHSAANASRVALSADVGSWTDICYFSCYAEARIKQQNRPNRTDCSCRPKKQFIRHRYQHKAYILFSWRGYVSLIITYNSDVTYLFLGTVQRGCVAQLVERRSLAGELSLSCTRPAADGWPLMWVSYPLQVSQLGQLSLSSFRGR